jgi:hypothetical protein
MTKSRFEFRTFVSNTMLNYHSSQKFKLIGRGKFNHLINTLTSNLLSSKVSVALSSTLVAKEVGWKGLLPFWVVAALLR